MNYATQRLSDTEALGIANDLLKAFGILYNVVPMKLTTSIEGGREVITRVFYDADKNEVVRQEEGVVDYKISDGYHLDNVYEFFWKRRKFRVMLYCSPEECGYFSLLPNSEDMPYVFCIIQEKDRHGSIKYEMCFGFDSEKKTFLELFDIDYYFYSTVFRGEDSIEEKLKGRVII